MKDMLGAKVTGAPQPIDVGSNGLIVEGAAAHKTKQIETAEVVFSQERLLVDLGFDSPLGNPTLRMSSSILLPAVVALMQWGDRWEADSAGPPVEITHRDCHHPVELILRCSHDHATVGARDTRPQPGSGARPA